MFHFENEACTIYSWFTWTFEKKWIHYGLWTETVIRDDRNFTDFAKSGGSFHQQRHKLVAMMKDVELQKGQKGN